MSELHDWLNTLSDMMKTEKIVLGDSDDMEGLLEKQKVTVFVYFSWFPFEVLMFPPPIQTIPAL